MKCHKNALQRCIAITKLSGAKYLRAPSGPGPWTFYPLYPPLLDGPAQSANGLKRPFGVKNVKCGPCHETDFYKNDTLSRSRTVTKCAKRYESKLEAIRYQVIKLILVVVQETIKPSVLKAVCPVTCTNLGTAEMTLTCM